MDYYYKQLISALYVAVYGRAPDLNGLRYWTQTMHDGQPYQHIADGFVAHPLYDHFYGNQSAREIVNSFYENILGGPGDAEGVAHWEQKLNEGHSAADVLSSFLESAMNIDLTHQGSLSYDEWQAAIYRQNVLKNKTEVGIFYAEHREAGSDVLENADNIYVQNDPRYIEARKILEGITANYDSVEGKKNFILNNYEKEPYLLDDDWQTWFTAFLDQLMSGNWDGDTSEFDQWESAFDDLNDDDFNWIFGQLDEENWNGDWGWLNAYIDLILGWLEGIEGAWANAFNDWGYGGLEGWNTDFINMFEGVDGWNGEDLGLLGLMAYDPGNMPDDFAF